MAAAAANPILKPLAIALRIAALVVVLGGAAYLMLAIGLPYIVAVTAGEPWRGPEGDAPLRAVVANLPVFFYLSAVSEAGNIFHRVAGGEIASDRNRRALVLAAVSIALGLAAPVLAPILLPAYV